MSRLAVISKAVVEQIKDADTLAVYTLMTVYDGKMNDEQIKDKLNLTPKRLSKAITGLKALGFVDEV